MMAPTIPTARPGERDPRRRSWWWQRGPVDSCCCCFSLPAGVAIMAADDFVWPTLALISYLLRRSSTEFKQEEEMVELVRNKYATECDGLDAAPDYCAFLAIRLVLARNAQFVIASAALQGGLSIVTGLVGLWAVDSSSVRAAKVYMWTFLPRCLLGLVIEQIQRHIIYNSLKPYGLEETVVKSGGYVLLAKLYILVKTMYIFKVLWSYHVLTKEIHHRSSPEEATSRDEHA